MSANYKEEVDEAAKNQRSHIEYLRRLVQGEAEDRHLNKEKPRHKTAHQSCPLSCPLGSVTLPGD